VHEFESEGGGAFAKRREGALAVLGFVVVEAERVIRLAVLPHPVEDARELVRGGGDGLGWAEPRAQAAVEAAKGAAAIGGGLRGAPQRGGDAANALRLWVFVTTPPVTRLSGQRASQDAKCFSAGKRLGSRPTSERIVWTVRASKPSMRVKSTPAMR
jgi:hypothetical protein